MAYDIFHNYDFEGKNKSDKPLTESFDNKEELLEDQYHGFFAPEDEEYLTEAYDNLPDWLISKLSTKHIKDGLTKLNVDLKNAVYTKCSPAAITKDFLYDPTKVVFLQLTIPGKWNTSHEFWIPRLQKDAECYVGDRYRKLSSVAIDKIKMFTTEVGYIDLADPMNTNKDIRKERSDLKKMYPDRDYSKTQYPKRVNVEYPKKDNGLTDWEHPISWDIEWITHRGYDKNGYPLDPDKYVRMLNNVGLDNYGQRLDRIYSQLEECRLELVALMNQYTLDDFDKYDIRDGWSRSVFALIGNHMREFSDMLDGYRRLKESVDRILRYKDKESIDSSLQYTFSYDGRSLTKDIQELKQQLKKARNLPLKQVED